MPIKFQPPKLIVTGGSANSLLLLAQQAFRLGSATQHLTRDDLLRCEGLLTALTAEEIAQRYGQPIARARILPAGALIIREMMSRLQLTEIAISPHGIREGALLAYARYGKNWLEQVSEIAAHGTQSENIVSEETFAEAGQHPPVQIILLRSIFLRTRPKRGLSFDLGTLGMVHREDFNY